jgi:hypothetical protein
MWNFVSRTVSVARSRSRSAICNFRTYQTLSPFAVSVWPSHLDGDQRSGLR